VPLAVIAARHVSHIQIIIRRALTTSLTKPLTNNRQRHENEQWKANSGTRLRRHGLHGVIRRPEFVDRATVTRARLRFPPLRSQTVSSQSSPLEVRDVPSRVLLSGKLGGPGAASSPEARSVEQHSTATELRALEYREHREISITYRA